MKPARSRASSADIADRPAYYRHRRANLLIGLATTIAAPKARVDQGAATAATGNQRLEIGHFPAIAGRTIEPQRMILPIEIRKGCQPKHTQPAGQNADRIAPISPPITQLIMASAPIPKPAERASGSRV